MELISLGVSLVCLAVSTLAMMSARRSALLAEEWAKHQTLNGDQ